MPLFDKVKAQATQLAQKAQEAGKAGQSKLEDVQARRRADGLLRDLGAATYAERSGRATGDTNAEIDRLMGELSVYEADLGPLDASGTEEPAEQEPPSEAEPPPQGGFTL
ncbi:MAG TPA: hypothetical protein VNE42_03910 [Acidimicrobiales bacterium]|nr:hypothetical protein [Acidimicrobiales bacterium]